MVFQLQPDIIVNNRNKLPGDFSTPEQTIRAEEGARAWESCMTLNDSWGYQAADDNWKTPRTVIRNLITCARDGGNYLLNIGPQPDGGIPPESERILRAAGEWVNRHGEALHGTDRCKVSRSTYANFTARDNTLYMHVHFWPGADVSISGLRNKVLSAKILKTGQAVSVAQDGFRTHITGLPATAPDSPVTTIAIECDGAPVQDTDYVRINKPRAGIGI
jgi:alpha-L-fucosidase